MHKIQEPLRTLNQYISMLVSMSPMWQVHLVKLVIHYYYLWLNVIMITRVNT